MIFEAKCGNCLFLVLLRISREYIAPNTVATVIIGVASVFQSIMEEMIRSSPRRFGVGGSPRLVTQVMVHQRVRRGVTNLYPRVMARVRVLFRS